MPLHDGYMIIVDDDEDDIQFLQDMLAESGIDTTVSFLSGKDLMHFLETTKSSPAFILLDYNMPVMNGLDVLQSIRSTDTCKHIPVYLFSTGYNQLDTEALKLAGATGCYPKPFSIDEAKTVLKEIMKNLALPNRL